MSHVLVTGASGFIGAQILKYLKQSGMTCTAVDVRPAEDVVTADMSQPGALSVILENVPPLDLVVHLIAKGEAEQGLVAGAALNSAAAVRVNIEGFVHLLEAAARHGARRVVWSSSTTVYGPASGYPAKISETELFGPTTVYGATKAACELLGPLIARRLGIEVVSLRLPMVYGPGRWYGGSQAPLVALAEALMMDKEVKIEAWSGDADWIHVADVAQAVSCLLKVKDPSLCYHAVGHRGSFAELAQAMLRAAGKSGDDWIQVVNDGAPDIPAVDDSLLRLHTGWKPVFFDALTGAKDYLGVKEERP